MCVDPDPTSEPSISLRNSVRVDHRRAIKSSGEHEAVAADRGVDCGGALLAARTMCPQYVDKLRVQRHSTMLMGLRVLLPPLTSDLADARLEHRHPGVEVEM